MNSTDYLLVCLAEECAEVQHAIAKTLRFGLEHEWPGKGTTNRDQIIRELRDIIDLVERLGWAPAVYTLEKVDEFQAKKFDGMMALSRELGRLVGP